ncbi:MAG TPA: hypothetical protein VF911_11890, partial [Thermoanaerobaculia bacterium]
MTIRTDIARLWRDAQRLYAFLLPLRFSFFALIVIAFAFLVSAQGYDIIAHIAEDDPTGALPPHTGQRVGFVFGFIFLALQVWYCSRQLLHAEPPKNAPRASDYPRLAKWLPRILGALAFVVGIVAVLRVRSHYGGGDASRELLKLAVFLALALIAFVAFTILRRRYIGESDGRQSGVQQWPRLTKILILVTLAAALLLFIWSTFFVQTTVRIGSAAVVLLAFALLVPVGSLLVWSGSRNRVPVLTLLLVWAFLISPFNDNHVIETLRRDTRARPSVASAFDRWFERLQSQSQPGADGKYPVMLVATEGGGIRAAYWTAAVLTSLTDTVPTFAEHTFAISGVSGGALGSTVYGALLVRRGDFHIALEELDYTPQIGEHHSLRLAASQMLSHDALAPTLAAMMQPDLVQRFVPFPILPDRARALEGGWERAWRTTIARPDGTPDDLFAGGFLEMMRGKEDRLPALFLNGTIVETGQRIVASNLRLDRDDGSGTELADAADLFDAIGADVRVSTAVDNSTRFTYVGPAATLTRGPHGADSGSTVDCAEGARCEHVVDGGYFENSGSATISDILEVIARSKYAPLVRPHVIFINFAMEQAPAVDSVRFGNEAFSPIRALLAVRGAHADLAEAELREDMGPANHTNFILLQPKSGAVFPLGWLLADRTRNLMDLQ